MANQATKQVTETQAFKQAVQKMASLDDVLNAKPKEATSSADYGDWVGTVTVVEENINALLAYKQQCPRRRFQLAIIDALIEAIQAGNGSHTFKDSSEAQEFDSKQVVSKYISTYAPSQKRKEKVSPDNPRMAHNWGAQLLGLHLRSDTVNHREWLAANSLPKDGMVAFFKVTKTKTS